MKVFWIAGDPSGDVQAAALLSAFKQRYPESQHVGWGGDAMKLQGLDRLYNFPANPIMGFVEVVMKARTIRDQFSSVKKDIHAAHPDLIVFVDFAGFNLRIAGWAKEHGYKTTYFIPPKVWAWKQSRLKKLIPSSDLILSILPFEQQWYAERGYEAFYVGNPLSEKYEFRSEHDSHSRKVLLLPGSRAQEVMRLLPIFYDLAALHSEYSFVVVRAPGAESFWPQMATPENVEIADAPISDVARGIRFAFTCSGTASLEISLLRIPQAVVYRANPLSLAIARSLVRVPYFSLPNLILNKEAVPELLQNDVNAEALSNMLEEDHHQQISDCQLLIERMGEQKLEHSAISRMVKLIES